MKDWAEYLIRQKLWGMDDPLFPSTRVECGDSRQFEVTGIDKKFWSNATPIRKIFREAFEQAGLPYYNPHSFRHLLVRYGQTLCQTPEDFKAWRQNLEHEPVLTTFLSYGCVESPRQGGDYSRTWDMSPIAQFRAKHAKACGRIASKIEITSRVTSLIAKAYRQSCGKAQQSGVLWGKSQESLVSQILPVKSASRLYIQIMCV